MDNYRLNPKLKLEVLPLTLTAGNPPGPEGTQMWQLAGGRPWPGYAQFPIHWNKRIPNFTCHHCPGQFIFIHLSYKFMEVSVFLSVKQGIEPKWPPKVPLHLQTVILFIAQQETRHFSPSGSFKYNCMACGSPIAFAPHFFIPIPSLPFSLFFHLYF